LIVVATITIARHTATRHAGDPKLIVLAARENMLAERIVQLANFLEHQQNQTPEFVATCMDTLRKNIERMHAIHQLLAPPSHIRYRNAHTDSLMQTIGIMIERARGSGRTLHNPADPALHHAALHNIVDINRLLIHQTHALLSGYLRHAEKNI